MTGVNPMTRVMEEKEKEKEKEKEELLRDPRTGGPIKGSTKGPRGPKNISRERPFQGRER